MPLFKKILVPVDGSSTSDKALSHALALAQDNQARVRLLHALDELAYVSAYEYSGELMKQARESADKMLQTGVNAARAKNVEVDTRLVDNPGQRLGETVADAYHFTRRYIQQGIAGIHVEDERNPKHSKHVNGLWSIEDQQARIDAARRAQRDSGLDFVIIARCDELYTSEMGGGGTGDWGEAVKRGHAYLEAGADILFYPPRPDWVGDLVKEFGSDKVATMGFSVPGTAFNMATGGWVTAAANHLKMMRELKEEGQVKSGNWNFPEKYELIEHPLYDGLIEEWADKTGRQSRPNHAP